MRPSGPPSPHLPPSWIGSASPASAKTTTGLLAAMLWEDGKLDFDKPVPTYVPDLKGTAWDAVTMKDAMNMASGLDIEETFANLVNPKTWIAKFFTAIFERNNFV